MYKFFGDNVVQFINVEMLTYLLLFICFNFIRLANSEKSGINIKSNLERIKLRTNLIRAQTVNDIREWSMVVGVIEESYPKTWTCSGVIISDKHILTAAHCLTNIYRNGCRPPILSNFKVKIGFTNLNDPDVVNQRETFRLSSYNIPNEFNGCSFELAMKSGRDIALLTLDRQIPQIFFDNKLASKVTLPSTTDSNLYIPDVQVKNAGYGKDETGVYGFLRNGTTYILNKDVCEGDRQRLQWLLDKNSAINLPWDSMCTTDHSILCDGDSGSPLLIEYEKSAFKLIGIAIQTAGCHVYRTKGGSGDVFTRVDVYQNWINQLLL